jgi:hypothetical protein
MALGYLAPSGPMLLDCCAGILPKLALLAILGLFRTSLRATAQTLADIGDPEFDPLTGVDATARATSDFEPTKTAPCPQKALLSVTPTYAMCSTPKCWAQPRPVSPTTPPE